ncbi:DUF1302 family protein [Denitratisoma oestradiolicum]|uniref:Cox2 cytochrome oxidase subunit 2 n=1 Tax=Denitratisoma oestradiolicum TaxID=311182 RepID=A0A6S6YKX8_9PROT|nr:DUF1302 family protein [Denitratisoma oestradiolicum]TWO79517.1 DUF1302 domain-containing protein [Denitratisoma oestradiolicum]CAB1368384.1 conserved exported protein of unknown function [Denitratisoma oestradiolicum]
MKRKSRLEHRRIVGFMALALAAMGATAVHGRSNDVSADGQAEPWKVDVYYENDTRYRGKDATGKKVGLSKFRNTIQVEADRKMGDGWAFHGVFRGTYDGVYRMNKDQFGEDAGSQSAADVRFRNTVSQSMGLASTVPFGGGLGKTTSNEALLPAGVPAVAGFGGDALVGLVYQGAFNVGLIPGVPPANTAFVDSYGANNPGTGLRVVGDRWHPADNGVSFAVPVRPCDTDSRGCRDFGGYGDRKLSELESPEFNERLDFLREVYVKKTFTLADGSDLFLKLGKQQVVWGRTDLFRVLDVINPVDYSRNNIYDELQDIRIPMWIAQAEWRMGASESMQERNFSVVWNFDKFRANNLGQCGTPNVALDAGCFFRGMANLWDNGGTVANFAHLSTGTTQLVQAGGGPALPTDAYLATNFGPGQIGIRDVRLPDWRFSNTQIGAKYEGVTQGGLSFSLNALHYRSQLPSLHAFNSAQNPFTSQNPDPTTHLIAFDMHFPKVNLLGGSMDFQSEALGAAFRLEGAMSWGEEFANTARPELYSRNKVWRSVIGIDRPTFVPFISTSRTTLISAQLFYQHIFDHEEYSGPLGRYGMPDWKNNVIGTLLIKGFIMNDRVSPQLIMARDFKAKAWVASPQVEWSFTDDFKVTVGANVKGKSDIGAWSWSDCRDCNPYAPYTQYDQHAQGLMPTGAGAGPLGLAGLEPLGRFRAGPIGAANKENEIYVTLRYQF